MAGHKPSILLRRGAIGFIAGLAASLASCSDRSTQCNRLIAVSNLAADRVLNVTQVATPQSAAALTQLADTLDRAAQQMQTVDVTDTQLQSYKNRFVSLYSNTATASHTLVTVRSQQQNAAAIQQAYRNLQSATQSEDALVIEVNNYCSGKN